MKTLFVTAGSLQGGEESERLIGTGGANLLDGGGGDDDLVGGAGADTLDGGAGVDLLDYGAETGSSGVVVFMAHGVARDSFGSLDRFTGMESVTGTSRNDRIVGGAHDGWRWFDGGAGDDTLDGVDGENGLTGGAGRDVLIGGVGYDFVNYANEGGAFGVMVDLEAGVAHDSFGDVDSLTSIDGVHATDKADQLYGDGASTWFDAGAGDDTVDGRGGDDAMTGGAGKDSLNGGTGFDTVDYGAETGAQGVTVFLNYGVARDSFSQLDRLFEIEHVIGGAQDDRLYGDDGDNRLDGRGGDDLLDGGGGDDDLVGGAGADTLDGGAGVDLLDYGAETGSSGVVVFMAHGVARDSFGSLDRFTGMESVTGTSRNDRIVGGAHDGWRWFDGGAGDDTLDGVDGENGLTGGAGRDVLIGGVGYDFVNYANEGGAFGVMVDLEAGVAHDSFGDVDSLTSIDGVHATDKADQLYGDGASTWFDAGAGDDTVDGRGGDDAMTGGAGKDSLNGGTGFDTVDYGAETGAQGVTVFLNYGVARDSFSQLDRLFEIEHVIGGAQDDRLYGDDGDNRLDGRGGDDLLDGGGGDDDLVGGAGADTLDGGDGDDTVSGGAGRDTIDGGSGRDRMRYDLDTAMTGVTVFLGHGVARDGFGALDHLTSIEEVVGSALVDRLYGDDSDNRLDGGAGDDLLEGGGGDDYLVGGDGADTLNGGAGRDDLIGGAGADTLDGGDGVDSVDYYVDATRGVLVRLDEGWAIDGDGDRDVLVSIEAVEGTDFDDVFVGSEADEYFSGDAGIDSYAGGGGSDQVAFHHGGFRGVWVDLDMGLAVDQYRNVEGLSGIEGIRGTRFADTILGGDGQDEFFAGLAGNDVLIGRGGSDRARYELDARYGGGGGVTVNLREGWAIDGFGDRDLLIGIERVSGTAQDDTFTGDDGNNKFDPRQGNDVIDGGEGWDHLDLAAGDRGVEVRLDEGWARDGFGDTDTLFFIEGVNGTSFGDLFVGDANGNYFEGHAGADHYDGGGGFDSVDYVNGAVQGVAVDLDAGSATDQFGNAETLSSIEGVRATHLADTLFGSNAADDSFTPMAGNDTVDGRGGDDMVRYDKDASYGGLSGVRVDLSMDQATDGFGDTDTLIDVEHVRGTDFADEIVGDDADNTLDGRAGNDLLVGGDGEDAFIGGDGRDTIRGGAGDDGLDFQDEGGDFGVIMYFGRGLARDTFGNWDSVESIEWVTGSVHSDMFIASDAAQSTWMNGDAGADAFFGGAGFDCVVFETNRAERGAWADLQMELAVDPFFNVETLWSIEELRGTNFPDQFLGDASDNVFEGYGGDDLFNGRGGIDEVDYARGYKRGGALGVEVRLDLGWARDGFGDEDTLISIENANGGAADDILVGDGGANRLDGREGDDTLNGGAGDDTLLGGDGNDTAVFSGMRSVYEIAARSDGEGLEIIGVIDGAADEVFDVEILRFDDGDVLVSNLSLDLLL